MKSKALVVISDKERQELETYNCKKRFITQSFNHQASVIADAEALWWIKIRKKYKLPDETLEFRCGGIFLMKKK